MQSLILVEMQLPLVALTHRKSPMNKRQGKAISNESEKGISVQFALFYLLQIIERALPGYVTSREIVR